MSRSYPLAFARPQFAIDIAGHEVPVTVTDSLQPGRAIMFQGDAVTLISTVPAAEAKTGILGELAQLGHNGNW